MKVLFALILFCSVSLVSGQTKTTQALDDKYEGRTLLFYRSTLKMLNQSDDKEYDEIIKDIEKIKFMIISKENSKFTNEDYKKLLFGYKSESYEEMMNGRYEGRNFDIYLREQEGDIKGTIILSNDSTSLIILDILGKIPLDKAPLLFKNIDKATDIGGIIRDLTKGGEDEKKKPELKKENGNKNH